MTRFVKLLFCVLLLSVLAAAQSLNGAGATFPYPMYSKWFSEYHKNNPNVQINYQSIGSGGGIRQVLAGTVDFGATDGPMSDEQLGQAKSKILHIPTVLGAVVPAYNVPGVNAELKFTPELLAKGYAETLEIEPGSENEAIHIPPRSGSAARRRGNRLFFSHAVSMRPSADIRSTPWSRSETHTLPALSSAKASMAPEDSRWIDR